MHRGAAGGVVQQGEQLFAERIAIDVRIRKDHSAPASESKRALVV